MSLVNALNILRPTLPYYLALTTQATAFEFRTHPKAPLLALEMAYLHEGGEFSYRTLPDKLSGGMRFIASDKGERTGVS